jgi:DNA segregation ATPase FtsK/SpoIIIE-like protein
MLFRHPSKAQLIRAQVPLIEDNEVEDVVAYAKKLAKPVYITLEDPKGKMGELEAGDEERKSGSFRCCGEAAETFIILVVVVVVVGETLPFWLLILAMELRLSVIMVKRSPWRQ